MKSTDIYFQNTRSSPFISASATTNKIPGSKVTSLPIKAGNAKSFKQYLKTPSLSL